MRRPLASPPNWCPQAFTLLGFFLTRCLSGLNCVLKEDTQEKATWRCSHTAGTPGATGSWKRQEGPSPRAFGGTGLPTSGPGASGPQTAGGHSLQFSATRCGAWWWRPQEAHAGARFASLKTRLRHSVSCFLGKTIQWGVDTCHGFRLL